MKKDIKRKYNIIPKENISWYIDFGKYMKFGTNKDKQKSSTSLIGKWCVDNNDLEYPLYCSCCHTHFSATMLGLDIDGDILMLAHCPICKSSIEVSYIDLRPIFKYKGKTQQQYLYEDYRNNT